MGEWRVKKRTLLIIAGLMWIIAGINILRIGIITWSDGSQEWLFKVGEAIIIFLLFFIFVFKRLFRKYTFLIDQKKEKSCPFSFFDVKGWIIMVFMITLGILVRKFHWFPDTFISVFYVGLSVALLITGILFIYRWWKIK